MQELLIPGRIITPKCPFDERTHFWLNSGMVRIWGKTLIIYRVNRLPSFLALSELDNNYQIIGAPRLLFGLSASNCVPEDPRLFVHGDRLGIFYVGITNNPSCEMFFAELDPNYNVVQREQLRYADNSAERQISLRVFGVSQQKNWLPIMVDGKLLCVYGHAPFTVLEYGRPECRKVFSGQRLAWDYGQIRGGASPVKHDGLWYSFFHSSKIEYRETPRQTNVYHVGCCTFDDSFRVHSMTPEPIMSGSKECYTEPWNRGGCISAVFPCGAVRDKDEWVLSYGYLDSAVRLAAIHAGEIENRLMPLRKKEPHEIFESV